MTGSSSASSGGLRAGDIVEVRGIDEVLATLDERARLEALPFMPEMLKFVGRRFRVAARADKTCDRVKRSGIRTMTNAVHLEGVRCDGAFHDGCGAACLIYWKEAWLKPVAGNETSPEPGDSQASLNEILRTNPAVKRIVETTKRPSSDGTGEPVYSCQATESLDYTSECPAHLKNSYWQDIRCGNVSWRDAARAYIVERFNEFQRRRGGTQYPPLAGSARTTPIETLDLRPGELVQVRTREEIFKTIDIEGRNRGLTFDREMLMYCGGTYRVLKRVNQIIDEPTGKMMQMKRDCIILDGVICTSKYHGLCPRAIYPFWREIWLRRASGQEPARKASDGEGSFVEFVLTSVFLMVKRRLGFTGESRS